MTLRIGVSRQQYQHLESKGNPRLNTLELITKGLKSELTLIPAEKLSFVKEVLDNNTPPSPIGKNQPDNHIEKNALANNPWQGLLGDDE